MFLTGEQVQELTKSLQQGGFYRIRGVTAIDRFDSQLAIGSVSGIKKISMWQPR